MVEAKQGADPKQRDDSVLVDIRGGERSFYTCAEILPELIQSGFEGLWHGEVRVAIFVRPKPLVKRVRQIQQPPTVAGTGCGYVELVDHEA